MQLNSTITIVVCRSSLVYIGAYPVTLRLHTLIYLGQYLVVVYSVTLDELLEVRLRNHRVASINSAILWFAGKGYS